MTRLRARPATWAAVSRARPAAARSVTTGTMKWAVSAKPGDHVPTGVDCEECHNARSWLPARMEHADVSEDCISCHNGGIASGKGQSHSQTSNQCWRLSQHAQLGRPELRSPRRGPGKLLHLPRRSGRDGQAETATFHRRTSATYVTRRVAGFRRLPSITAAWLPAPASPATTTRP